jgi:hypothetical protein
MNKEPAKPGSGEGVTYISAMSAAEIAANTVAFLDGVTI